MNSRWWRGPAENTAIQFVRYFFTGGAAFAVDFGTLWLLTEAFGLRYLLSAAAAFAAGLATNYAISIRWVFSRRTLRSRRAELAGFAAVGIAGLGLNEAILWCVTEVSGLHYMLAKMLSAAAVFLWNFTARKYLLFYGKKES